MLLKRIFFAILLLFLLSGCRSVTTENGSFLISAIGADMQGDNVLVSVEAVVVNSADSDSPPQNIVYKAEGKDFKSALKSIGFKTSKPLDFSHCAIIVLSDNLKENVKNDIYDFCRKEKEITVSVGFVETENANKLLSLKPWSEISVGYELAVMLETQYRENNITFNNRFFEIENARLKGDSGNIKPKFIIDKDSFYLEGGKN